jgi:hypothetical protein
LLAASGADDVTLIAGVDASDLATADLGSRSLHDATNVLRFTALRDGDPPGLGAPPLDERVRSIVTSLGTATADAATRAGTSEALHAGSVAARQSAHGVNLDEEMLSIVSHQRALEAASRAMTIIDEALDTLINRTGIVGRQARHETDRLALAAERKGMTGAATALRDEIAERLVPFVVCGAGRSGTGYASQAFTATGHPCSHEEIFDPFRHGPDFGELQGDSSWLALPFLDQPDELSRCMAYWVVWNRRSRGSRTATGRTCATAWRI